MQSSRALKPLLAIFLTSFFVAALPMAVHAPVGGRSAERQAYTAGIIRRYCHEPNHSVLKGPQIHFGNNPFNLEFTGFEWAQGVVARAVGGPSCDAVEPVAKVFSVFWSGWAVVAVALLALHLWGGMAGILAALLLCVDAVWLRYSAYTMIENRVLACALFAILFSLQRRRALGFLFWVLTFVQKPQIFLFSSGLWVGFELFPVWLSAQKIKRISLPHDFLAFCKVYCAAVLVAFAWFGWSNHIGRASDLPWIIHTGPRAMRWYFGTEFEQLSWLYLRGQGLGWLRDSGVLIGFGVLALLALLQSKRERARWMKTALLALSERVLPYIFGTFVYTFIFYHVFIAHEYYALPLNVGRSLTLAGVLALLISALDNKSFRGKSKKIATGVVIAVTAIVVGRSVVVGARDYSQFIKDADDPKKFYYYPSWNKQVFPERDRFVVMAIPGTGRDLLYLYLAKQRGFMWCVQNKKFAPRAFWKQQGVEYVGWSGGVDPKSRQEIWIVRTIDEELAYARQHGYSSDIDDVWAGKTMSEWAAIASRDGRDPCLNESDFDPRTW